MEVHELNSLLRREVCGLRFGCWKKLRFALLPSVFLASTGLAAEAVAPVELKSGATRRLLVSRVAGVRSLNSRVVAVERDPLSGALRIRGVAPGNAKLTVDFRDTGISEEVNVRVVGSSKRKSVSKKRNVESPKARLFELPGW